MKYWQNFISNTIQLSVWPVCVAKFSEFREISIILRTKSNTCSFCGKTLHSLALFIICSFILPFMCACVRLSIDRSIVSLFVTSFFLSCFFTHPPTYLFFHPFISVIFIHSFQWWCGVCISLWSTPRYKKKFTKNLKKFLEMRTSSNKLPQNWS